MNREILDKLIPLTEEEKKLISGRKEINRVLYMESGQNVINSKKLLEQGKLITIRPHTRFVHFPPHVHDYIEVVYMCCGTTRHIINGDTIDLKEGELLFLSRNATQEIMPAGKYDIAVNFIVMPQFFDRTLAMLTNEETPIKSFLTDCLKNTDSSTPYLYFKVSDVLPIRNLVENLVWNLIYKEPNKRQINQNTMGLLFLLLLNYTERLEYKNKDDELIINVLRYVEENYVNGSLTELAESLHYEFAWLSREIKNRTGKNYTRLVQERRLAQAEFLIKNSDIKISEIARQTGYDNISYFHRLFNKTYKMTPKKYRDLIRNNK